MNRLRSTLDRIDRKGYGAYKDLQGSHDFGEFVLHIDKVQRDPFAPPSLVRVRTHNNRFDPALFENSVRRIAFEDFLTRGALISLGGLETRLGGEMSDAGHKGSGLALLIELDSVIGGGFSPYIDPTVHDEGRWIRQIFEAWRIDTLLPREQALEQISRTVGDIRKHGGPKMLLPGERELRLRAEALECGIAYSPVQIERLNRTGAEVGLPPLEPLKQPR